MIKDFDKWNERKKLLNNMHINKNFSEREVWFMSMGVNIGYEQDGKGEEYLRPVLILKKFNKRIFLGIPLTKIEKESPFYFTFEFKNNKSTMILSQVRLFDSRRLKFRYGKVSKHNFNETKKKLIKLIK